MYPTDVQWRLFRQYQDCPPPMHPREFLQNWELDYPQVAQLLGVTRDSVAHWLSGDDRQPSEHYCRRLATIDFFWKNSDRIPKPLLDEWCGF
ncbi:helix-turn-helix transcriptional regulator [Leptolyngbya sp. FACHB-16]|uniref:helix-turn-helix domain-containing protein n=1 Tax=unclassified Leptolyngbya TaxID=2650499 RepID=UPI00168490A6|nr:helix-turn-helix transcriptional regulator [Leptolyngbya sp. FACHB-16]MBD2156750.1 helix-turn-helix domain-containing protein [Leptolyngbya sp. FACHB-16]